MNSCYIFCVALLLLVAICSAQDDILDEVHECESFRKCKDCLNIEYCVKWTTTSLQRWWTECPRNTPYCNPYSQRCEATITPICQSIQPSTPSG